MANAIAVSDNLSNAPEQKEQIAKVVGSGQRRKVFEAIYYHKAPIKTVSAIAKRSGVPRLRVLQEARELYRKGVVKRAPDQDGEVAYEMIETVHAHKREILKLIDNPKKLAGLVTKRRPALTVKVKVSGSRGKGVQRSAVAQVTLDDIESFKEVRKIKPDGNLPDSVSEEAFKLGVQAILRETSQWKDWGGEFFDLSTNRVVFKGRRTPSVFAFKGPGTKGSLVPGKMGKNGDQIQRLFLGNAQLFILQYWRDIKSSVGDQMQSMAVAKSVATGDKIYYAIVDGVDSYRLYRAYRGKFPAESRRRKRKVKKATRR